MLSLLEKDMISIVRSSLDGSVPNVSEDFDWEWAYNFAKDMQIIPLVCYGMEKLPNAFSTIESKKFLKSTISYSFFSECQDSEIESVLEAFDKEKIEYVRLKGTTIKKLYPRPEMRLMSDADILIRAEQYELFKTIMIELGYKETVESDHEYVWSKDSFCIELHKRLIPSYNKDYYEYFGDGWRLAKPKAEKPNEYEMSSEDTFIYLFTHFAKHYRDAGIGIKHLTDFYVYLKHHDDLDWSYIEIELKKLQLYEFWLTTENVINVWFGSQECDEKSAFVTHKIFSGTAYGTYEARVLSEGVKISKTTKHVRAKRFWKGVFPPYKDLKQRFKFLKKLPILLPLAWLCRWVSVIFNPKRIARKKKDFESISQENIKSYQDELNYVGLDFNFE